MPPSLRRLARALSRQGISVALSGHVYTFSRPGSTDAQVLLPEGFAVEAKAVRQLLAFSGVRHPSGGRVVAAKATPDFHPGSTVPVGAVVVTTPDLVVPQAIGTDIQCGMRLHTAELDLDTFQAGRDRFVALLRRDLLMGGRDLPLHRDTMRNALQHGIVGFLDSLRDPRHRMGALLASDVDQLDAEVDTAVAGMGSADGDLSWAPEDLLPTDRTVLRDGYLGTVGGGNHFVEIQVVDEVLDRKAAWRMQPGLQRGRICIMVHTGSRQVGQAIGRRWAERAVELWPKHVRRPASGILPLHGPAARSYLGAMNTAANYGAVNRMLVAELVRLRLREVYGTDLAVPLVYDAPHNLVFEENGHFVHRKGATPAHADQPVLIPGSMGHPSYLMRGLGNRDFVSSASHGAGRALTRFEMARRKRLGLDLGLACVDCITLKEERRIEEAPAAYKDIDAVVDVQVQQGIVAPVARLRPLLSVKS